MNVVAGISIRKEVVPFNSIPVETINKQRFPQLHIKYSPIKYLGENLTPPISYAITVEPQPQPPNPNPLMIPALGHTAPTPVTFGRTNILF